MNRNAFDCLIGLLSYVHGSCWELASDFSDFPLYYLFFYLHEFYCSRLGVYDLSVLSLDLEPVIPRIYVL